MKPRTRVLVSEPDVRSFVKSSLRSVLKAKNLPNRSIFINVQLTLCTTGSHMNHMSTGWLAHRLQSVGYIQQMTDGNCSSVKLLEQTPPTWINIHLLSLMKVLNLNKHPWKSIIFDFWFLYDQWVHDIKSVFLIQTVVQDLQRLLQSDVWKHGDKHVLCFLYSVHFAESTLIILDLIPEHSIHQKIQVWSSYCEWMFLYSQGVACCPSVFLSPFVFVSFCHPCEWWTFVCLCSGSNVSSLAINLLSCLSIL